MDFDFRLDTPDRLAKAGIDKIGLGALIGLEDWRTDCVYVAEHLHYLEKTYWQSRYSISFPRLRPCEGALQPKSVMSDKQLVQLICAFRLLNSEKWSCHCRPVRQPQFRDNVAMLGITSMSARHRKLSRAVMLIRKPNWSSLRPAMSVLPGKLSRQSKPRVWKRFGTTGIPFTLAER